MREYAPRPARARLTVQVDVRVANVSFRATARNLGVGGISVEGDRPLRVGERALIHFTLPSLEWPLSVLAEVVWVREHPDHDTRRYRAGLRFDGPSVGTIVAIEDLVRGRLEDLTPTGPG